MMSYHFGFPLDCGVAIFNFARYSNSTKTEPFNNVSIMFEGYPWSVTRGKGGGGHALRDV